MSDVAKRKVPEIRFEGFEEEWENLHFDDLFSVNNNKSLQVKASEYLSYGTYPIVDQGQDLIAGYTNKEQAHRDVPVIVFGDHTRCLKWVNFAFCPGADGIQILKSRFHVLFSYYLLSAIDIPNMGYNRHLSLLKEKEFILPLDNKEQQKIGNFFKHLDASINQHQTKLDKLQSLKQAMLQKMFPRGDARVPEIRFEGFEGEWEERELGEICNIIGGGTPSTLVAEYWNGSIDWYSPTEIGKKVYADGSVRKITQAGLESSSAQMLPANRTVLFTSRAGIGDMAILRHEGCTNQGFQSLVLNNEVDSYFIYSMGYLIKEYALKHASGSTFLEISSKQLGKMSLLLPCNKEQQKIGAYFRKLDELIALERTQLDKLKQIKEACLSGMFV